DKLSQAIKEYLKNSELLEACFQCFINKNLSEKVCCWIFYDTSCITHHFNTVYLKEELLECN
ncbi:hypothetical protein ASPCADRAFT_59250, partial [Aspergillus carbonarius ITEM 5010]